MPSDRPTGFSLNPGLDVAALQSRFQLDRRLRIENFLLEESAQRLAAALAAEPRWIYVMNGGSTIFEIPRATYEALPAEERQRIEGAVLASAAHGFQFRYESIRVPDEEEARIASGTAVDDFARFMSSEEVVGLLRQISAIPDIDFADAQATRYWHGDFLTRHDDDVAGKHRRMAYVMGLTPEWRAEWGGLLLFSGVDGDVVETLVPRFNALSLFAVPQPHSVSYLAPSAPHPRVSVTGWLRHRP